MANLKIFFLRHGQTELSRDNLFCGSGMNPGITADGLRMAECFADAYSGTPWEAFYASPLVRAVQTATPISKAVGKELILRDGLKEIGYGDWEGKSVEVVNRDHHDDHVRWTADPAWCAPTKGERAVDIEQRARQVVGEIVAQHKSGNVLVVSHKATIRIILCSLLGIDVGRFRFRLDCPVCSLSLVEFTNSGPQLRVMADRSHLPKELKELPGT